MGQWNLCWGSGALAHEQCSTSPPPQALPCFPFPATSHVHCHLPLGLVTGHVGEEEAYVLLSPYTSCCGLGTVSGRVGVRCLRLAVSWGVVGANPAPGWKHPGAFGGSASSLSPIQVPTVPRCGGLNNPWASLSTVCRGWAVGREDAWLCFLRALVWSVIRRENPATIRPEHILRAPPPSPPAP